MTDVQKCFIELIKNVVLDVDLPDTFKICDLVELYKLSKKQDMAHIVAHGLKENNLIDLKSDLWNECYKKQYSLAQFRVANLLHEYKNVCNVFEEVGIDYIPLKGAIIRDLYPEPWMRVSSDIDILVHAEDLNKAEEELIKKLAYKVKIDGVEIEHYHDYLKAPSGFAVELHFRLSSTDKAVKKYLDDVWNKSEVVKKTQHQYKMTNGMFYLYHIYHASKHFKEGGCGVKTVLDTYLINNILKMNSKNYHKDFKSAELLNFAETMEYIAKKWFENISFDNASNTEEYIISGGVYGGGNHYAAYQSATDGKSIKYYFKRAFPSYNYIRKRYPRIKGKPYLLPYFWLKRILTAFSSKENKRTKNEIKTAWLEKEKSKEIKKMFDELGL